MLIRNERPYALEIAATGQVVQPGDTAEVDDDLGKSLAEQDENWSAVSGKSKKTEAAPSGEEA